MVLTKVVQENIQKFLNEEQETITTGKSIGKKKWKKVPIKKLSGFELCKDGDGKPLLQYNDGKQRTGLTIKDMTQFGHMKGQMLNNWNKEVDYLTELAKYIFDSDNVISDNVLSI